MKKRFVLVFLMLLVLGALAGGVLAQDDETPPSIVSTIEFPEGWDVTELRYDVYRLTQDGALMVVYGPTEFAKLGKADGGNNADLLSNVLSNLGYTVNEAVRAEEGAVVAVADVAIERRNQVGLALLVEVEDGFVMVILRADGSMSNDQIEDANAIAQAFSADTAVETSGETGSCVLTTASADTARVRVGPGENRTPVAFLAADVEYVAEGLFEGDDGTIWFRVNKEEAAPGKAINEAWVAAADVNTSGNCTEIGEVDAPPVIPITSQQPADTGSSDSGSSGDSGDSGQSAPPAPPASSVELVTIILNNPKGNGIDCTVTGGFRGGSFGNPTYDFTVPDGGSMTLQIQPGTYAYNAGAGCVGVTSDFVITYAPGDVDIFNFNAN